MGEALKSDAAFWDYQDGLGPLRDAELIRMQTIVEKTALLYGEYKKETVSEQAGLLEGLYEKKCGHPISEQRVFVRAKTLFPITKDQAKKTAKNNYASDTCYIVRTPRMSGKYVEGEYILDSVQLPRIYETHRAAFKLRPTNQKIDPTISHYYVPFDSVIELDFMEHFTINAGELPNKLTEMGREGFLYFEMAGFADTNPQQLRRTAANMQRSMTRKLQPLIDTKTNLMLSTPVYYSEQSKIPKVPEIEEYARHEAADSESAVLVGRALGIAIKRDNSHEPYPYKPFFIMRNDEQGQTYAIPTDQPVDVFDL